MTESDYHTAQLSLGEDMCLHPLVPESYLWGPFVKSQITLTLHQQWFYFDYTFTNSVQCSGSLIADSRSALNFRWMNTWPDRVHSPGLHDFPALPWLMPWWHQFTCTFQLQCAMSSKIWLYHAEFTGPVLTCMSSTNAGLNGVLSYLDHDRRQCIN